MDSTENVLLANNANDANTSTRVLRSSTNKPKDSTLAKNASTVVQEPTEGFRDIRVPKASKSSNSDKKAESKNDDMLSDDMDDDYDIMGNTIQRKELALFLHAYL